MDEKLNEGETKPKITRSRARHIRRKRLISARRAAENDSSIATNVESERSNDSKSPENHRVEESLSKSKARRLRKRNKTRTDQSIEKNNQEKKDIVNSPLRDKKTYNEDIVVLSTKSTIGAEFSSSKIEIFESTTNDNEPVCSKVTASENELFENEKNRKISENTRSHVDSETSFDKNYKSDITTIETRRDKSLNLIKNDDTNSRTKDVPKITENFIEEIIRETKISSIDEKRTKEDNDDVALTNLKTEISKSSTKSDQIIGRMNSQEKTREQVKAEREAKKAAKAAAKGKSREAKPEITKNVTSSKDLADVSKQKVCETRGDVVDGEILPMIDKLSILSSTFNKKPEVIDIVSSQTEAKNDGKSKSELRAERRAKQEAQRAVKQSQALEKQKPKIVNLMAEITNTTTVAKKIEDTDKKIVKRAIVKENLHEVNLFKHLYHEREQALINAPIVNSNIHPAIVRLGVRYADKVIVGSNARCVALLAAVKQLIKDFERPSQADFTRGLEASLQESSAYLHHCRPLAVSMQNALRHLKWQMTQLSSTTSDEEAKTKLENAIDTYIQEQIQLADKAISITIQTKISNGDVILTYGYSSLIYKILCDAHDAGRQFRVVVVDGRPWLEGREQLRRLAKYGLECSYVLINALSFIMPQVSKVFLGAHAILANGAVMSRVGTAQVALMAKSFNVPVLVACETHKTCERVQTDSIVYNEIADADELAQNPMGSTKKTSLINWRGKKSLNLLNITYDVTPADLVTAVVTELAILPCTSVPVILRIKPSEI